MNPTKEMILVTGATGQIGTVLTEALRAEYGPDNVLATDIRKPEHPAGLFETLDILNTQLLKQLVEQYKVTTIYHLAAILSASGEANPQRTWNINMNGLLSILELARESGLQKVFYPSTIAVFGKTTPRINTPQHTVMTPSTVYGISKAAGELWCEYYHQRFGLDVRSVRYPGIISYQSMPGGGTTDYAVDIFHQAILHGKYTCFLEADTRLPMMYMDDSIRATLELMRAPSEQIKIRTSYNLAAMSFTPAELAASIKKHMPDFTIDYAPDHRQAIAASWTESIDDRDARADWGWKHEYDLDAMTLEMLTQLKKKYNH
ncbi:MAG TPA: NAD-dependent epimerase/dehydratase family protein, partial [Saprospiraceae bacterium]|nr:NAD-dependent epimerase/dehydratase family protein [Saprospiraceae bacterium]